MRFWDVYFREPLRKALMRLLLFTERKPVLPPTPQRKVSVFRRDIHIPPVLVGAVSAALLFGVFILGLGWSWRVLLGVFLFVGLILAVFALFLRYDLPELLRDDEAVMLLGTLLVLFAAVVTAFRARPLSVLLTPLPAAALLAAMLLHRRVAAVLAVILAVIFGVLHEFSFDCFFIALFGGLAGVAVGVQIRTHKDFIRAGSVIAAVHIVVLGLLALVHRHSFAEFFVGSGWMVLNGFLSAMLALGLLPFLESFFLRVTPLKLMELADFNQPLLKRLMVEAPGTYHHSLIMATLAESAARIVGANPLLCRVGAYYHDIGKLVKPEYFIENQGVIAGGQNPHGNIAPTLSTLVVISHVKEGVALARQAKLPQEIIDFIPMHHGTSRIEYFYRQAVEDAQENFIEHLDEAADLEEVGEENYRYPGPKPISKETAILMIADSCEAAARTLENPTHTRFKDLVHRLIEQKLRDGQFNRSPLTLADLDKIKEALAGTLTSVHHERIEYPPEAAR
jgi:putative nucleotidyltransferase with HDIG domain